MITRREMLSKYPAATACNGQGAVLVCEMLGRPSVWVYAPSTLGGWGRRDEYRGLVDVAMKKIGWKRDNRCTGGWRKLPS